MLLRSYRRISAGRNWVTFATVAGKVAPKGCTALHLEDAPSSPHLTQIAIQGGAAPGLSLATLKRSLAARLGSPRRRRCSRPPWRKRRRSQSPRRQPEAVRPRRSTRSRCCSCGRDGCSARPQAPECGGTPSCVLRRVAWLPPRASPSEQLRESIADRPILTWLFVSHRLLLVNPHPLGVRRPPLNQNACTRQIVRRAPWNQVRTLQT